MRRIVFPVFVALAAAGCMQQQADAPAAPVQTATSAPATPTPMPAPTQAPAHIVPAKLETAEVTFIDDSSFDDELSSELSKNVEEVDIVAPERFGLNKIPDRLEKWLTEVKDSGGKVKVQPMPGETQVATRGVVDMAFDLVVAIVQGVRNRQLYGPSHDYDVYLYYRKDTGIVEQAKFVRREG